MSSNKWQVVMLYELLHAAYAVLPKYFEPVVAAWLLVCNRLMGTPIDNTDWPNAAHPES